MDYELQKEQLEVLKRIEIATNATRGSTHFIFWNTVLMGIMTLLLMFIAINI